MCYNKISDRDLPLGLGLHHFAGNIQVVEFLALDDEFLIIRVERVQDDRVAALDVLFQRALAVCP